MQMAANLGIPWYAMRPVLLCLGRCIQVRRAVLHNVIVRFCIGHTNTSVRNTRNCVPPAGAAAASASMRQLGQGWRCGAPKRTASSLRGNSSSICHASWASVICATSCQAEIAACRTRHLATGHPTCAGTSHAQDGSHHTESELPPNEARMEWQGLAATAACCVPAAVSTR